MIDVTNKRVTVMGLGVHGGGIGVAKWLLKHGARVTITDLKTAAELKESIAAVKKIGKPFELVLGQHRTSDFTDTDLVIKNQGVPDSSPYLVAAKKASVPIETDIGIFVENFTGTIAGVTGTKGKTTTTTLLHKMLAATGQSALLGGNLRKSTLDELDYTSSKTLMVLELSSFQLESFGEHKISPHVAVWTNLFPDHLDRYKTMELYKAAKANIMLYQGEHDVFVTNADQPELVKLARQARGRAILFSTTKELPEGLFVRGAELVARLDGREQVLATINKLVLRGKHNIANILAAMAGALALDVPIETIREVAETFTGVANRLELVRTLKGVSYINDTTSSIPHSAIAALNAFDQPIILIAGGSEKNLPLDQLARAILERTKKVLLLETPVGLKLADLMREMDPERTKAIVVLPNGKNMRDAVRRAQKQAVSGDVVLLSPGAASFGMFRNEFDRGDQFVVAVKALK